MDKIKGWIDSFAADVGAVQAVAGEAKLAREARLAAAAALGYLVTRLDLIPDWEETRGIIDDAMVLRVAMSEAAGHDLEALPEDDQRAVHRLANETETVGEFLGADLYPRFKRYVADLQHAVVRGRHPSTVVDDDATRARLYAEVAEELKRLPPAPMSDPERVARIVRNYLSHKLK
jgi:uncharacterized membrane protein YkvA (DUF1232 family)